MLGGDAYFVIAPLLLAACVWLVLGSPLAGGGDRLCLLILGRHRVSAPRSPSRGGGALRSCRDVDAAAARRTPSRTGSAGRPRRTLPARGSCFGRSSSTCCAGRSPWSAWPSTDLFAHKDRLEQRPLHLGRHAGSFGPPSTASPSQLPMVHGHVAQQHLAFFPVSRWSSGGLSAITALAGGRRQSAISGVTGLTAVARRGHAGPPIRRHRAGPNGPRCCSRSFPGTFVFSLVYSEGIVITCVAFGLLALLRRQWWLGRHPRTGGQRPPLPSPWPSWSAAPGAPGSEIRRPRNWRSLSAPILAPLGFVGYMVWLWVHTGNLGAWRLAERGGWKSYPSLALPDPHRHHLRRRPGRADPHRSAAVVGTVVAVIGAVFAIRERQPAPVLLYGLVAAGMAAISAPVGLRPRFLMLAFPLIIAVGTRLRGRAYWLGVGRLRLLPGRS